MLLGFVVWGGVVCGFDNFRWCEILSRFLFCVLFNLVLKVGIFIVLFRSVVMI